jgi:predicted metal-dependent hydrolase
MQFDFRFDPERPVFPGENWVTVGRKRVRFHFIRHRRARRYVLRLRPDGSARVTIPRSGSIAEASRFVHKNIPWLQRQILRQASQPAWTRPWQVGTQILFRGQPVFLELAPNGEPGLVRFATENVRISGSETDLQPLVERHLWRLAARELEARVLELAALHEIRVEHVTIRNQRSRWGSCSRRGAISLNWRLVQTPEFVRDYIVLHELAHLREMNHSSRFWREVARLCPNFAEAEKWLKANSWLLR